MLNKIYTGFVLSLAAALSAVPLSALAHETHVYEINGVEYEMVIGSLNEPVIVDDKTGVSLEITRDTELFIGAQDLLQVEMIAGEKKRIENFSPVHGQEGQYKTNFLATVPTTLEYRIFGELEGVPFDQTFACNPVGHPASVEDTTRIDVSEGVVQTLRRGNFGCPQPKEALGFPEEAASLVSLQNEIDDTNDAVKTSASQPERVATTDDTAQNTLVYIALGISVLSLLVGICAILVRRREPQVATIQ